MSDKGKMIKLITEVSYSEKLEKEQDKTEESRRVILINNCMWVEMGAGTVGVSTAAGWRGNPILQSLQDHWKVFRGLCQTSGF